MLGQSDFKTIDVGVFIIANVVNLLLIGIFLSRVKRVVNVEFVLGIVVVAMALPLIGAVIANILSRREWWTIVLLLPMILYCIVELVLDYVLKVKLRSTSLLWPYLTLFYLGLIGMVGYSFSVGKAYGLLTLVTYFLNLFAAWYSYSKVRHG
jgi:CDP-diglyceride synthetase